MPSTGYIDASGVYHRAKKIPLKKLVRTQQTMFKQSDHARQRFDHSAEILQPYDHNGKPNKKFIEAYPDAAAEYGFIPRTQPEAPKESDIPAVGSVPWGQSAPKNQRPL